MLKKNYLLAPGPTPVPNEILLAGAQETIHHRTPQFIKILEETMTNAKVLFQTKQDVYCLVASGTGAMETAVVNLVSEGEKVIVADGGKFGERWRKLCQAYGANLVVIDIEWGDYLRPEQLEKTLNEHPDAKVVFTTHSETSTGTVNPIEDIAKITRNTDVILVTDSVSGLLAEPLKMDDWGVDVVATGLQKGVMLPPGLALISLSEKAWKKVDQANTKRFYFNLNQYKKGYPDSPWTPGVNQIYQLKKALEMVMDEGIENVWNRHQILADATRLGVQALGLELLSKRPGNVTTAVLSPVDTGKLTKLMRDGYGVTMAGGQDHLKGKIFRMAHLGYMGKFDIIIGLSAIEMALTELGHSIELGAGVKAAEKFFLKGSC